MEQALVTEFFSSLKQSVYIFYGVFFLLIFILQPLCLKSIYAGIISRENRAPGYLICLVFINLSIFVTIFIYLYCLLDIFVLYKKFILEYLTPLFNINSYEEINESYKNLIIIYLSLLIPPIILNALVLGILMQIIYWHTNIIIHSLVALIYQLLNIIILYPSIILLLYLFNFEVITNYLENSLLIMLN